MNAHSDRPGTSISAPSESPICEVTGIGPQGFWLFVDDSEYFVPLTDHNAFRLAIIEQIFDVQRIGPRQVRWEALDIDVELDALLEPEHYPLAWQ